MAPDRQLQQWTGRDGGRRGGEPLEAGLGFRLGRAHRVLQEAWQDEIADLGLSPPQAAVVRAVCEGPASGLRELARRLSTDAMNAKRIADHLEGRGLVRSVADPRHRQRRVLVPTEEGATLAAEIARRGRAWDRRLSQLLGDRESRRLSQSLACLERGLESHALGHRRPAPAGTRHPGTAGAP